MACYQLQFHVHCSRLLCEQALCFSFEAIASSAMALDATASQNPALWPPGTRQEYPGEANTQNLHQFSNDNN